MIFVLTVLLTFVYDRKNENHWSFTHYSLLISRNTNTRIIIIKSSAYDVSNLIVLMFRTYMVSSIGQAINNSFSSLFSILL